MTTVYKEPFDDDPTRHAAPVHGVPPSAEPVTHLKFRVLTANVQSVPEGALSLDEALQDLQRNAADGDLVFLQEIAGRYRPLVREAFPASDWEVFYGEDDNHEPIAFRTAMFKLVDGKVSVLHRARRGMHARRYTTYLRLRVKTLGTDLHATNLHMVAGAFSNRPTLDQDERIAEWHDGIDLHREFIEELVRTGAPVVGGGDYNRQLRKGKSLGSKVAGKPVTYAVGRGSTDLLWFVDGDQVSWRVKRTEVFRARHKENALRNSDHGARRATVVLRVVSDAEPDLEPDLEPEHEPKRGPKQPKGPKPVHENPYRGHGPFERTLFGDTTKRVVDWKTRAALEEAERKLGYTLTVVQGSYNEGRVPASGPTHDGGGVVDLIAYDWKRKVRVLRSIGFAAWYRPKTSDWNPHIHAVLIKHGNLDPSAARQVESYLRGRNGLRDDGPDPFPRPDPIPVFHYPPQVSSGPAGGKKPPHKGPQRNGQAEPSGSPVPPHGALDGVDISHHQRGRLSIPKAQAAGVKFLYAKTTEGTTVVDDTYRAKMRMARRAGMPFGSYHFARPDGDDARQEALSFLRRADIRAGDMVPMLDLEATGGLNRAQLTAWVGRWITTVEQELARKGLVGKPIIYTRFDLDDGFGCKVWVARYNETGEPPRIPAPWKRAAIWQHSNGVIGPVDDVPGLGHVDVNALHPDVPLSVLRLRPGTASSGPRPMQIPDKPLKKRKRKNQKRPNLRTVNSKG